MRCIRLAVHTITPDTTHMPHQRLTITKHQIMYTVHLVQTGIESADRAAGPRRATHTPHCGGATLGEEDLQVCSHRGILTIVRNVLSQQERICSAPVRVADARASCLPYHSLLPPDSEGDSLPPHCTSNHHTARVSDKVRGHGRVCGFACSRCRCRSTIRRRCSPPRPRSPPSVRTSPASP